MKHIVNDITFGLLTLLEENASIVNTKVTESSSATLQMISDWEKNQEFSLPSDLKNFYLTTDGLLIQWSVNLAGQISPLGKIEINPIEALLSLKEHFQFCTTDYSLVEEVLGENSIDLDEQGRSKPILTDHCFVLQSDSEYGKVCLYIKKNDVKVSSTKDSRKETTAEIWYLDRALQWFFLAPCFTQYFRMLVIHMGIPGWQYSLSNVGVTPEAQKWFNLFIPQLVNGSQGPAIIDQQRHQIDFVTLFKHKSNEKKKNEQSKQNKTNLKQKQSRTSVNRPTKR